MHLVIHFAGTGASGKSFGVHDEYLDHQHGIKKIFVEGCHHREVCGSMVSPMIKQFSERFTKKLFSASESKPKEKLHFTTKSTKDDPGLEKLKIGIKVEKKLKVERDGDKKEIRKVSSDVNTEEEITQITLCGYSRGAVTCFAVAKELFKIAPDLPVNIVANQPVPGFVHTGTGTTAEHILDCSELSNVKKTTILLGSYTGSKSGKTSAFHRAFFSQIKPKMHESTEEAITILPRASHLDRGISGKEHMHMSIAKYLHEDGRKITKGVCDEKVKAVKKEYKRQIRIAVKKTKVGYPDPNTLQEIFGLEKKGAAIYEDYKDPLFLETKKTIEAKRSKKAQAPQDYKDLQSYYTSLDEKQSLIEWWDSNDKHISSFSSFKTKALVRLIKKTDKADLASMEKLSAQANQWMDKKRGTKSSRVGKVQVFQDILSHEIQKIQKIQKIKKVSSVTEKIFKGIDSGENFEASFEKFKQQKKSTVASEITPEANANSQQKTEKTTDQIDDNYLTRKHALVKSFLNNQQERYQTRVDKLSSKSGKISGLKFDNLVLKAKLTKIKNLENQLGSVDEVSASKLNTVLRKINDSSDKNLLLKTSTKNKWSKRSVSKRKNTFIRQKDQLLESVNTIDSKHISNKIILLLASKNNENLIGDFKEITKSIGDDVYRQVNEKLIDKLKKINSNEECETIQRNIDTLAGHNMTTVTENEITTILKTNKPMTDTERADYHANVVLGN